MTHRILPDFLTQGDRTLGAPRLTPLTCMRAAMGMPPRETVPPLILSSSKDEGTPAREWLRHVEAGRIGGK